MLPHSLAAEVVLRGFLKIFGFRCPQIQFSGPYGVRHF